jgi:hypothetical protein
MIDDGEMGVLAFDVSIADLLSACEPLAEQLAALMVLLEATLRIDTELPPAIAMHIREDPATLPDRELRELSIHRLLDAIACRAAADAQVPF